VAQKSISKTKTALLLVLGGVFFYIFGAVLSTLFFPIAPLAEDWCLDGEGVRVGPGSYRFECLEFRNKLEEAKFQHNRSIPLRMRFLVGVEFLLGFSVVSLFFYFVPERSGESKKAGPDFLLWLSLLAFLMTVVIPMLLGWLLPPPVGWIPFLGDVQDARVAYLLKTLRN
jgi:hypothetical protein